MELFAVLIETSIAQFFASLLDASSLISEMVRDLGGTCLKTPDEET